MTSINMKYNKERHLELLRRIKDSEKNVLKPEQ